MLHGEMRLNPEVAMNPRTPHRWLACILIAMGACAPLPLYGQSVPHYLPYGSHPQWAVAPAYGWAHGAAAGAHLGAQVSAMNPMIRCSGGRSFTCGARLDPRPMFVGALIGGLIGHALSSQHENAPLPYYGAASTGAPSASWAPEGSSEPPPRAASRAPSIADNWTHIGEVRREGFGRDAAARSQFVEEWQRFFEPSTKGASSAMVTQP